MCKQANDEVSALPAPTPGSLASYSTVFAGFVPIYDDLIPGLEALTPPANEQSAYSQLLDGFHEQRDVLPQIRAAAEAGDAQQVLKLVNDLSELPVNSISRDLGLDECAKNVEPQG